MFLVTLSPSEFRKPVFLCDSGQVSRYGSVVPVVQSSLAGLVFSASLPATEVAGYYHSIPYGTGFTYLTGWVFRSWLMR
jgi:hypothetical protein